MRSLVPLCFLGACAAEAGSPPSDPSPPKEDAGAGAGPGPGDGPLPTSEPFPRPCPDLFDQEALRTFFIEIAPEEWAALEAEYASALDDTPYHPLIAFRHEDDVRTDAMIRLRSNPRHFHLQEKMQFQISFNEIDPDGRYAGLRKIVLDSAHYHPTYLADRLAASVFQELGLPVPCANHARLFVNGELYGLYTNLEKIDREFLERNFDDPRGLLYKEGKDLVTREDENPDTSRNDEFWATTDLARVQELGDLRQMIEMWAVEATLPDGDGYWAGGWNMYLYDHPTRGFLYLPHDLDLSFDGPVEVDPLSWRMNPDNFNGRPHVQAVLDHPVWRCRFADRVIAAVRVYDGDVLTERIDRWAAQIEEAAAADLHAPWTFEEHLAALAGLRWYVVERAAFLGRFAGCP